MSVTVVVVLVAWFVFLAFYGWALCRAAARGDRR